MRYAFNFLQKGTNIIIIRSFVCGIIEINRVIGIIYNFQPKSGDERQNSRNRMSMPQHITP